jgi:hypothetical protein
MSQQLSVRAPKFDRYEFVTLYWNEQTLQGKVVKRWLNLDESLWLYQLAGVGSDRLFPEAALAVSLPAPSDNG